MRFRGLLLGRCAGRRRRLFEHDFADAGGKGEADVRVDVDFADGAAGGLTELLFRDADGVFEGAAGRVDLADVFLRNGGRAVEDDREAGQAAGDFFEDVKAEMRVFAGLELVCAVGGADGDGEGVDAGRLDEFLNLVRVGVKRFFGVDGDGVFDSGEGSQLGFDGNTAGVRVFDDFFVSAMFASNGWEEQSIMTEVNPVSMHSRQVSKSAPWSRWRAKSMPKSSQAARASALR